MYGGLFLYVLIGLMQLGTRRSDDSCEAAEDLISGFSAIEAEAELVQIGLKLCAAAVISAEQERLKTSAKFFKRDALCSCHANDLLRFLRSLNAKVKVI